MTESTDYPVPTFLRQRLLIGLVSILNVIALVVLFAKLQQLLSKDEFDLIGTVSAISALVTPYPLWKLAKTLVIGPTTGARITEKNQRALVIFGHLAFWGFVLLLCWVILPWTSEFCRERAQDAKDQRQYTKAIDYLERSLYQNSDNALAYYDLAVIYEELADIEDAIKQYRMGIHVDPGYPADAFNNLARLLLLRGENSGALDLLDLAEQRSDQALPAEKWIRTGVIDKNRAWAYYNRELYSEAETYILSARGHLEAAQKLSEYPEVDCLHALIAWRNYDSDLAKRTAKLCTQSYEKHRNDYSKPFQGASRELYLQVLAHQFGT